MKRLNQNAEKHPLENDLIKIEIMIIEKYTFSLALAAVTLSFTLEESFW